MKASISSLSFLLLAVASKGDTLVEVDDSQSLGNPLHPRLVGENHKNGVLSQTQDQKTVVCPVDAQDLYEGHLQYGLRTRFVLKNTASDPVVVTFVHRNGTEYSAANAHIRPANMDPESMLAPGITKVFAVHEGHVFHVRDSVTGELLMQHRAGLVPVQNQYSREITFCPQSAPNETVSEHDKHDFRVMKKFPQWKPSQLERFDGETSLDVGFRNTVKSQSGNLCPVNFFFVRKQDSGRRRPPQFFERFSFQLGGNDMAIDQDETPDAATKYERTTLGHDFVARLAHDDSQVVDYLSVGPIKVQDCAPKKKKAITTASQALPIVIPVGKHTDVAEDGNNNTEWKAVLLNTTESMRGFYFKMYTE